MINVVEKGLIGIQQDKLRDIRIDRDYTQYNDINRDTRVPRDINKSRKIRLNWMKRDELGCNRINIHFSKNEDRKNVKSRSKFSFHKYRLRKISYLLY